MINEFIRPIVFIDYIENEFTVFNLNEIWGDTGSEPDFTVAIEFYMNSNAIRKINCIVHDKLVYFVAQFKNSNPISIEELTKRLTNDREIRLGTD